MAKRKIPEAALIPALLDVSSFSSNSIGDANIDTAGYDPTWDEPYLGKPRIVEAVAPQPASNPDGVEEFPLELEPNSPPVEVSASVAVEVLPVDPPVIVGEACVERIDELSYEEECDRLHLERKVERAFYEAGKALRSKGLEPIDLEILELLDRAVVLTPREVEVLEGIEGRVF